MKIDNIPVTSDTLIKTYKKYYPAYFKQITDANKFHYLMLWGIRVSTCDTSLPDDIVGGLRINNFNFFESVVSTASTEPSPSWIANPMSDARRLGGTAFVKDGQYAYRYMGKRHSQFAPYPSFCPIKPMDVYRFTPTQAEVNDWKRNKIPLSKAFEQAVKSGRAIVSKSPDTCIHRSWGKERLFNDSAGCQILTNYDALNTIGTWADSHIKKKYGNSFIYTLFTKEQFVDANTAASKNWWEVTIPKF